MSELLVATDTSQIVEGMRPKVEVAFAELVRFVKETEPRAIAYRVSFDPDGRHVTVFQVHPDSASMEYHMEIAGPMFAKFRELLRLREMHVYGRPSARLLEQLRNKVALLGTGSLTVHATFAGFDRSPTP